MKIVLCATPSFPSETPPLGLAYLKASLVEAGHDVTCFDFSRGHANLVTPKGPLQDVNAGIERNREVLDSWVARIEAAAPDLVGLTLWVSTKHTACMLARALRERLPGVAVIGGGPDVLDDGGREAYLSCFDYLIEKEGERAICRFLAEHQATGSVTRTPGVWRGAVGDPGLTAPAERITDLDALPYPDFSDFDIDAYEEGIPVLFSRGCNANCTFCTNKKYFAHQVSRSGPGMYDEVRTHVRNTGCRRFVFADDSLLSAANLPAFMSFCDLLLRHRLGIRWRVYAQRIIPALERRHVKRMRKAGLEQITFGVESFSSRVRRDMGKTVSDRVTHRVLSDFVGQGIRVALLMIYGYPVETEEDFEETLHWIRKRGKRFSHVCFNVFVPSEEYCQRRPGVVRFEDGVWHHHRWRSEIVDLEARKQRFLRLVQVLEAAGMPYMIAEPRLEAFHRTWDRKTREAFEAAWGTGA